MPPANRNRRTLQNLRTRSGSADETSQPHRAYLKLAWLEMERARRGIERHSVMRRLRQIDARLAEIEAEVAATRGKIADAAHGIAGSHGTTRLGPVRDRKRQFKVKY